MILTEDQRRWWFATHPEYSWSHREIRGSSGNGRRSENKKSENKVDPKDVDEYVDNALEYETDKSVIALLKSVKRNFGSEADAWETQKLGLLGDKQESEWIKLAQFYPDGGLIVPRLPTTDELFRLPKEMVKKFYDSLDRLLQNNPLLIDPNAFEGHHGLPKKFINYFLDCGMELDEFIMIMRAADHRLKAESEGRGGVHTGKGRGGDWNTEWEKFIDRHPAEDSEERRDEIRDKFNEMVKTFGLEGKHILSPKKNRRK